MALITNRTTGLCTVGDVIKALEKFPADMPAGGSLAAVLQVYREEPEGGEGYADPRGQITIDGDEDYSG